MHRRLSIRGIVVTSLLSLVSCRAPEPIPASRYATSDALFEAVQRNIEESAFLRKVVEIDHSRLAAERGAIMPPARVILFSNPELQARLVQRNPLVGIDLPLRVLSFEDQSTREARLVRNRFEYIAVRHDLEPDLSGEYEASMSTALAGIAPVHVRVVPVDRLDERGIVTIESEFDFETTLQRVREAIESQDDTLWFGTIDFASDGAGVGIDVRPATLMLFGGPVPGAKAMSDAPILGLDAFCQKLLVWQDDEGRVQVSFNDLLVLADRFEVGRSLPLRVINRRITQTFSEAVRSR
jgi:uncharacterized protein (DUF302 family)